MRQQLTKNTFARRIGRSLRAAQQDLVDTFLPAIAIDNGTDFGLFKKSYKAINLEIGIGNGEFFIQNASANTDTLHIGCEPYMNCVATVLRAVKGNGLENVRLFTDDARLLLKLMPDSALDSIYIICPDPWPKRKQYSRRLVTAGFINLLTRKLSINGRLIIVTDHEDYAEWILRALKESGSVVLPHEDLSAYLNLPEGWLHTKYQRKGLAKNHRIYYFNVKPFAAI